MRASLPAERFSVAAEINVTPMIDVMLVLLIIFMVVTPALVRAELPESRTAAAERDRHPVLVIERSGAYRAGVGDETRPVSADRLQARLAELYAPRPQDHVLYLKADRAVGYARVLTALDAARAVGVRRVAAITVRPAKDAGR